MLKLALIGCGRSVTVGHAPALTALPDRYQVVAIADRSPEALASVGMLLGIAPEHRYADYRDLLLREDIEVVDITVPNAFRHDIAAAFLSVGVHLITERPLALSLHDAEDLLKLAEMHGKLITVMHYLLYYPPFAEGLRLVRAGQIGEPFFIRCEGVSGGFGAGTETYHPAWQENIDIAGGGVWLESGYHSAYLCSELMNSPVISVTARIGSYQNDDGVDDTATALCTHENNGISSIQAAWSVPSGGRRVFEIYGSEGSIVYDHDGYTLGIFSNKTQSWHHPEITLERAGSFIGIYRALADCLQYGAIPPVSHRDALHTQRIITAGYRASENDTVEGVEIE